MAEAKEKGSPKVSVSSILSKEENDTKPKMKSAPKEEKSDKSGKTSKKKHKHAHIENHYDEQGNPKGHTVRLTPQDGGPETSFAAKDLDEVHDGLEEHMGEPNGDEGQESPMQQPAPQPQMQSAQPSPQGM